MCIWLRKGYVGHRKNRWGYGCTTPPCLHWYTTVVTWRCRNSSKWWHIILLRTSLGRGRTFSYNPLFFSSPAQQVLPLTNLLSPQDRGKFTLSILTPPLSSPLMYLHSFIYSNLREVPARRCSGFLGIAGLKEIANMER
jgi:hypothetical protein